MTTAKLASGAASAAKIADGAVLPAKIPDDPLAGAPLGAPAAPAAASQSFLGAGNLTPKAPRCRKHKVRKRGRCVNNRHKKSHKKHRRARGKRATHKQGGGK